MMYLIQYLDKSIWCPYCTVPHANDAIRKMVDCGNELIALGKPLPDIRTIVWYPGMPMFNHTLHVVTEYKHAKLPR